jgi:type I restriction-modification system DNA methylase subunit
MPRVRFSPKNNSTANLGFEAKLWPAADKLRSNMDAAGCKHVALGVIFLMRDALQQCERLQANAKLNRAVKTETLRPECQPT